MTSIITPAVEKSTTSNQSYLVAAIGRKKGALVQCFAKNERNASDAVAALFIDTFSEAVIAVNCVDTDAAVGTFIEGDPAYIQSVIENTRRN